MPIVVADIEAELVSRLKGFLLAADMDATTADGNNPDLRAAVAEGCRFAGLALSASPLYALDADLAALADADVPALLDVAELRAARNARQRIVTISVSFSSGKKADYGEIRDAMDRAIMDLESRCRRLHGYGLAAPRYVPVDLDFQESGDGTVTDSLGG